MRRVLASESPVAAAAELSASASFRYCVSVQFEQDVFADRHYMQRGSGSNIVLGEADGLYDAAAACLAVGLLAKLSREN